MYNIVRYPELGKPEGKKKKTEACCVSDGRKSFKAHYRTEAPENLRKSYLLINTNELKMFAKDLEGKHFQDIFEFRHGQFSTLCSVGPFFYLLKQ